MLPIETTFTSEPKMIMRSYRACHRTTYVTRWVLAIGAVIIGLATRSPGLVGAGVIGWIAMEGTVRRQLRDYLAGPREVTLTITEDEYKTQGPDRATSRTWTTFQKVSRVGEFWVLRLSNVAAMAIPADALDAAQTEAFVALMQRKGLLAD